MRITKYIEIALSITAIPTAISYGTPISIKKNERDPSVIPIPIGICDSKPIRTANEKKIER